MTPATPFMLEILRRIETADRKLQPTSGYVEAWPYPLGTLKALEKRGYLVGATAYKLGTDEVHKAIGGYVRLTHAGRAALEPPVKELDDLVVLDEEKAL